jgi:hypothetical protein
VTLHQVAIGPESGQATIHVSRHDDCSSLLPISELQDRLFPGTGEIATETIRAGRLAEFLTPDDIRAPALLKLDVQGYELEALKGCAALLDRFDYVIAEGSFVELYKGQALAHEIIRYLDQHGFRLVNVYNLSSDHGRAVQAEFGFEKKPP